MDYRARGRNEGHRSGDYFIAFADTVGPQRHHQRVRSRVEPDNVVDADYASHGRFEPGDAWSEHEIRLGQDVVYAGKQLGFFRRVTLPQVDERYADTVGTLHAATIARRRWSICWANAVLPGIRLTRERLREILRALPPKETSMSLENVSELMKRLSEDSQLKQEFDKSIAGKEGKEGAAAAVEFARNHGCEFSIEECLQARSALEQQSVKDGAVQDELSEEQLDAVAGGLSQPTLLKQFGGPASIDSVSDW